MSIRNNTLCHLEIKKDSLFEGGLNLIRLELSQWDCF